MSHEERLERSLAALPGRSDADSAHEGGWSSHFSFATYNLGNLSRPSWVPRGTDWQASSTDIKMNMMLNFIARNSAHVMAICEAAGLENPLKRGELERTNWKLAVSSDTNMALGVRGLNASIRVLLDTTSSEYQFRDFTDDPTPLGTKESYLWYMIAEITFGEETNRHVNPPKREPIQRARQDTYRIAVFHINNKAATDKLAYVRLRMRQMVLDLFRYQTDVIGGDANMSIFRYFKAQRVPSIVQSSLYVMLMRAKKALNENLPLHQNVGVQVTTSSPLSTLDQADRYSETPNHD